MFLISKSCVPKLEHNMMLLSSTGKYLHCLHRVVKKQHRQNEAVGDRRKRIEILFSFQSF